MESGDSEFAKLTLPTSKAVLKARCHDVPGNKQKLVARAIGCPKPHFVHELAISWSAEKRYEYTFFHPPSLFLGNCCNCNCVSICTAWQFWVKLHLLYTALTNACSEIGPEVTAATFRDFLGERLRRAFTRANQLH